MKPLSRILFMLALLVAGARAAETVTGTVSKSDPVPGWPMVSGPYSNENQAAAELLEATK